MTEHKDELRNRVYCSSCGISEKKRQGVAPIGWQVMANVNKRTISLCPDCVRSNLWMIEARLDIDPTTDF